MTVPRGTQPRVRLGSPTDVLATIPFLVGYHPSDSIVVLGLAGTRITFAARDDLPPTGESPADDHVAQDDHVDHHDLAAHHEHVAHHDLAAHHEHVAQLVEVVLRQGCRRVVLVGYGDEERVTPTVEALRVAFDRAGVTVVDALRADGRRYWSYLCTNEHCCPPQGTPYDTSTSEVAVAWTLAGRVARRDRAEYEAQIQPVSGAAREAMRRATAAAHERLLTLLAEAEDDAQAEAALLNAGNLAIATALDRQLHGIPPTDEEAAWLSVLLQSTAIRDIAWSLIRGCGPGLYHHRALWQEVLHRAEPDLVPAPASLFAFAAWRSGDGGIARLALQRALEVDPRYRMARLLHQAITHGLPPTALDGWPEGLDAIIRRRRRRRGRSGRHQAGRPAG